MPKNFLKEIRESKNIRQNALAKSTGLNAQNISDFENGKHGLRPENLEKIAAVLGVSINHILTGESEESLEKRRRKTLEKAIELAGTYYIDLGRDKIIKIAFEIIPLLEKLEYLGSDEEKKEFLESLEVNYVSGLAANCVLNSENKT